MKRLLVIFSLLLLSLPVVAAKSAYKITLQIDGNRDSALLMGYYYGQNTYVCDTAVNNGSGRFVFESNRDLLPGLYFFCNNSGRYVEFVVYNEKPNFSFHTSEQNWMRNMTCKKSVQNEIFYRYHHNTELLYDQLLDAEKEMDSASYTEFKKRQMQRLDSVKLSIIEKYPQSLVSKMMNSTREVQIPTVDADGNKLTREQQYEWFMSHYFDNMPIDDNFFVRTPKALFYNHVTDYVDKYMRGMPPAMICPLLDSLIDRAEPAPEVYKWLVHNLTEKFLQSNVMVYDEVYVHLVQRYYATGKAFWSSPSVVDEQVERATKWENILVGRVAPELILFDTLHRPHSLHHMPGRYTLLLFWSPTCGHCREIVPAVYSVFEKLADSLDMTAFAILSEPDEKTVVKWKNFLREHSMTDARWVHLNGGEANVDWREVYDVTTTPQIFLIDNSDHTIVAKKLGASLLEQIGNDILKKKL